MYFLRFLTRAPQAAKSRGDAYDDDVERSMSLSPSRRHLLMESPETTIGPAVHMKGELSFGKLLRIDGTFSGKLVSTGDLIVGESGVLHGNIENMGEVMVDGKVVGNITVERVELRGRAEVHGNITCKSLSIDSSVIVIGNLNVHPGAPAKLSPGSEFDHPEKTVPVEEGSKSSHDKARDKPEKTKRRSSTSSKHEQEKDKEESKGKENKHHKKKEDKEMSGGQEEEGAGGGGDALATEAPTATGE
jgi:cytoskeletal protein CcmA (bactofilin family)